MRIAAGVKLARERGLRYSSPMERAPLGVPLRERKRDIFFVIAFGLFTCSSIFSDAFHALGITTGAFGDANAYYAEIAGDTFFASNPLPLRVRLYFSAFLFGPITAALTYAFVRGVNGIRPLALMYAGTMVVGVAEFFGWEYASGTPATNTAVFIAFNGPYFLIPLLLAVRMWQPNPFGVRATSA
jgi:hypothetical protein